MQITSRTSRQNGVTPAIGVLGGILYLVTCTAGGKPLYGVIGLAVMVAFSAFPVVLGRRSETVHPRPGSGRLKSGTGISPPAGTTARPA
jgi:hypothetical protein